MIVSFSVLLSLIQPLLIVWVDDEGKIVRVGTYPCTDLDPTPLVIPRWVFNLWKLRCQPSRCLRSSFLRYLSSLRALLSDEAT